MALPLDARICEDDLKRARKALPRAKAVGEEYEGVEVATATVRARRAGEAIVREAKRRGVEAIVLAAEEPTRVRGGPLLGGKRGPARHLRRRDHPLRRHQGALPGHPHRPARRGPPAPAAAEPRSARAAAARGRSDAAARALAARERRHLGSGRGRDAARRLESAPMFVLVVGAGRVGSSVATAALRAGPHRLRARRGPALARAPRRRARAGLGGGRRALHDRHGARDGRADRGGHRGGRRLHRLHQRRQHEPRRLADRPAPLRRPEGDRARARPAARRLVRRAGRADDLPDRRSRSSSSPPRRWRRRARRRWPGCT